MNKPNQNSETLSVNNHTLKGRLKVFTGKSGNFFLSIIPSLKVSGYGNTAESSLKDLSYNLKQFCKDLFDLDPIHRKIELNKLGWIKKKYLNKKYSQTFVDEQGILNSFDEPNSVQSKILDPETI